MRTTNIIGRQVLRITPGGFTNTVHRPDPPDRLGRAQEVMAAARRAMRRLSGEMKHAPIVQREGGA